MILVDANILMYAAGSDHPNKVACVELLRKVAAGDLEAAIDAEVLQEILHRYRAIGRWEKGREVYDLARRLFTTIIPIDAPALDRARLLLDRHHELTARDALHAAVNQQVGASQFCSFDRDFDCIRTLNRVEPAALME